MEKVQDDDDSSSTVMDEDGSSEESSNSQCDIDESNENMPSNSCNNRFVLLKGK